MTAARHPLVLACGNAGRANPTARAQRGKGCPASSGFIAGHIILQLLAYWWEPGNLPHPSKATIAAAIGVNPRTVQKRIAAMETAKFIKRIERRTTRSGSATNLYDFSGLIAAAQPFAKEELQEIEQRKKDKAAKLERKRPRLAVVKS